MQYRLKLLLRNNTDKVTPHLLILPGSRSEKLRFIFFNSSDMNSGDIQLVYPITDRHSAAGGGPMDRDGSTRVKFNTELTGATYWFD